jgi:hypothetical protein
MFSISPGMSSGQAGRYLSREDYYLRETELGDNSRWVGKGTKELGLHGEVGEESFRALCRGGGPGRKPARRPQDDPRQGDRRADGVPSCWERRNLFRAQVDLHRLLPPGLEAGNLELVKELADSVQSVTDREGVGSYLERYEEVEGVRLKDGQKEQVLTELAGTHGASLAEGKAGSGKTMASKVIERFNAEELKPEGALHHQPRVHGQGCAEDESLQRSAQFHH